MLPQNPDSKNVYLSAPGLCCCAGSHREQYFQSALEGNQKGFKRVLAPDGKEYVVGKIDDSQLLPFDAFLSRILRIADTALEQIRPEIINVIHKFGSNRIVVCVGSCDNGSEESLAAHETFFQNGNFPSTYNLAKQSAVFPAQHIAERFGITGPVIATATACASSAGAIIKGAQLIRAGFCDAAIVGGVDIVSPTVLLGFASLEAVSSEICNPFSKNRSGITLGEGAAFFVLSRNNNGGLLLAGIGESDDANHMTAPSPDGSGAVLAMKEALKNANINPSDIDYINLHGTGTPLNDSMEAKAVQTVFSNNPPFVSSTKSITGHTLGAAGALELALCWMVLDSARNNNGKALLPLHCWDKELDDAIPLLKFAEPGAEAENIQYCMSNSYAFGGCNTSLILRLC
jgi:3-oxoacyl-[acyl-carrier-protein] synthase-1